MRQLQNQAHRLLRHLPELRRQPGLQLIIMSNHNNLRTRLETYFKAKFGSDGASVRRLLKASKGHVLKALEDAKGVCDAYGYFIVPILETGNQISAKLFALSEYESRLKSTKEFTEQYGYPLNFQIFSANDKVFVCSFPEGKGSKVVICSDNQKDIQNAIIAEVEGLIKAGVEFLGKSNGRK
jgi:hypothetical protein